MDIVYCIESKIHHPILPGTFAGKKATEIHDWHHFLSRTALCGALDSLEEKYSAETISITDHLHLSDNKELLVSLSHTKDHAVGLACKVSDGVKSIGVDLEKRERKIKEGIEKFYYNDHDEMKLQYDDLLLWSLKEACFKALSPFIKNFQEKTFVLKDIWVRESHFGLTSDPDRPLGMVDYALEVHADELLLISFAMLIHNE